MAGVNTVDGLPDSVATANGCSAPAQPPATPAEICFFRCGESAQAVLMRLAGHFRPPSRTECAWTFECPANQPWRRDGKATANGGPVQNIARGLRDLLFRRLEWTLRARTRRQATPGRSSCPEYFAQAFFPRISRGRHYVMQQECNISSSHPRCMIVAHLEFACPGRRGILFGGVPCVQTRTSSTSTGFEVTSKRRKGFPSETQVKRGDRVVGGYKELLEKLGRNDPCPCGSGLRFQAVLHAARGARWLGTRSLLLGSEVAA